MCVNFSGVVHELFFASGSPFHKSILVMISGWYHVCKLSHGKAVATPDFQTPSAGIVQHWSLTAPSDQYMALYMCTHAITLTYCIQDLHLDNCSMLCPCTTACHSHIHHLIHSLSKPDVVRPRFQLMSGALLMRATASCQP